MLATATQPDPQDGPNDQLALAFGEAVQLRRLLRDARGQAESDRALQADAARQEAARAAEMARLTAELDVLRTQLARVRASMSWRITMPLRVAARAMRSAILRAPPHHAAPAAPAGLFAPVAPAAEAGATLTIDQLHELSRSL